MLLRSWPGITVLVFASALAFSQTDQPPLGDVARDSKRTHRSGQSSQVITNDDLREHTPTPAPDEAVPVLVAKSDTVKVYYRQMGTDIEIRIEVPENFFPILRVDVNRDGVIDRRDTYYGVRDQSTACTGYLISERLNTKCGSFVSDSDLKVTTGDDGTDFTWTIPKRELSRNEDGASFVVAYYSKSSGWQYFPSASFANPIKITF